MSPPSNTSFPIAGIARDGHSSPTHATATCYCGAIQLLAPLTAPGLVTTFACHCADCREITASTFATNFIVLASHLQHVRGKENLSEYGQSATIASANRMTNYFCKTCGTLMYRIGAQWPEQRILRVGTVDDFALHETVLKPQSEIFVEGRVGWVAPIEGARQVEGQTKVVRAKM